MTYFELLIRALHEKNHAVRVIDDPIALRLFSPEELAVWERRLARQLRLPSDSFRSTEAAVNQRLVSRLDKSNIFAADQVLCTKAPPGN